MLAFLRLYRRVLALLAPERGLAFALALGRPGAGRAALRRAGAVRQGGRAAVDRGAPPGRRVWREALALLLAWGAIGATAAAVGALVTVYTDRMAHRQRLAAMAGYFEHVLRLPLAFHARSHSGRLLKVMLQGTDQLFGTWLGFYREHLRRCCRCWCCCR
jgi:ATP-binding cassette subfamily B protein